jgi:hypothetical protein
MPTLTSKCGLNLPPGEEAILNKYGLKGVRKRVLLKDIDFEKSRENKARYVAINTEDVEDIKLGIIAGEELPAIILATDGSSKPVIWSGNHRAMANLELGLKDIDAVVVKCTDECLWDIVPRQFNTTGGRKSSRDENFSAATNAVLKWKWTEAKAAETYKLTVHQLKHALRLHRVRHRMEGLGISTGKIGKSQTETLGTLQNDHVLTEAANIVLTGKLTGDQCTDLVKELKKERTESSQLRIAAEQREQLIGKAKFTLPQAKTTRSVKISFKMAMNSLLKILGEISNVGQIGYTEKEEATQARQGLERIASESLRVAAGKARRKSTSSKAS